MGLNDLTLEKLISEINGYKEKMRAIHEDYGRASQDLQDRINVLGYNLNEHLKETKDQMATTPQRLLNLETKYVTGEVNESEYRSQRQEFKGLLEKNLRSIEEIKQMIDVLSHIETKPLAPAEFKQTYPGDARPTSGEEWGRGAFIQEKTYSPILPSSSSPQAPTTALPRISSETSIPDKQIVENPQPSSPFPPQPQNNGNRWWIPQSNNALFSPMTSSEVQGNSTPILAATAPQPSTAATDASTDDSIGTGPAPDLVEDVADALVVKVVDDIPTVDASATVATEAAQIQAMAPGTETIPTLQSSSELSPAGLTPPSQFYKVVCPKCGADVPKPAKVWELKGGKSKKNVLIGLFQCQDCRVKFREALTREIL